MQASPRKLAIFCGSNLGTDSQYIKASEELADVMSRLDIGLVYGGAKVGLMGIIANRMLQNGSEVIGVMPRSLVEIEVAHPSLTKLHTVNSMSERKELMAELSDGFIMLPGGAGTLDEFFEMFTTAQLGYHAKPCAILNTNGYYDSLLEFLDNAVSQGFVKKIHRDMIIVTQSPPTLIDKVIAYQAPREKKWTV